MEYNLNKTYIKLDTADTPDFVNFIIPETNRLETYLRAKALPSELYQLITNYNNAKRVLNKILLAAPTLQKIKPKYYPNSVVELNWPMDDGSKFLLTFNNWQDNLTTEKENYIITHTGRIGWNFTSKNKIHSGYFKDEEELMEFISNNIH